MKYFALLLTLLACVIPATALPTPLKALEVYEIDAEEYEADPQKAVRRLSYFGLHDSAGRVAESWSFANYGDGAQYTRTVYNYDRNGRKTAELRYLSDRLTQRKYFFVKRSGREFNVLPDAADKLNEVLIMAYDRGGRLIEQRMTDGEGNLKQRLAFEYNNRGDEVGYSNSMGDGTIVCRSSTSYTADGQISTQVYGSCNNGPTRKVITKRDKSRRPLLEEQYSLPAGAEPAAPSPQLVLTSRSVTSYSGETTHTDWTIWNADGTPQQRLVIVDKGDQEISRKEFSPVNSEKGKITWLPAEELVRELVRDKRGEIVKEFVRKRSSPDSRFKLTDVIERIVTYL